MGEREIEITEGESTDKVESVNSTSSKGTGLVERVKIRG